MAQRKRRIIKVFLEFYTWERERFVTVVVGGKKEETRRKRKQRGVVCISFTYHLIYTE